MNESDFCSNDVLQKADYIDSFQAQYQWNPDQWEPIRKDLAALRARAQDKCLYLGVAGEFSSGKSTLINALLRQKLLKEDIIQGTTCAPTFLRYSKQFNVEVQFLDETCVRLSDLKEYASAYQTINDWFKKRSAADLNKNSDESAPKEFQQIRAFINKYSAEETCSSSVKHVTIYLDSALLQSGIVIVDTPGINAANPRHGQVTEETLKDYCDAALLLIPAETPCSATLCSFVRRHLEKIQSHSIAVVTQIDRVRERERDRQLKYVARRLEAESDCQFSAVLPAAAWYVLNSATDCKLSEEKQDELRTQFYETEKTIVKLLTEGRQVIIRNKLMSILRDSLIPQLKEIIRKKQNEYEQRVSDLEKNQLCDLDRFLNELKWQAHTNINSILIDTESIQTQMKNRIDLDIEQWFLAATTTDELRSLANVTLPQTILPSRYNEALSQVYSDCNCFSSEAVQLWQLAIWLFNQEYQDLCKNERSRIPNLQYSSGYTFSNPAPFESNNMQQILSEHDGGTLVTGGTGAIWGAIIGSSLIPIPVIGTVLGGAIGGFIGTMFIDFNETKIKVQCELSISISDYIDQHVVPELDRTADRCRAETIIWFNNQVDFLKKENGEYVELLILEEKKKQENLLNLIKKAQNDLETLEELKM